MTVLMVGVWYWLLKKTTHCMSCTAKNYCNQQIDTQTYIFQARYRHFGSNYVEGSDSILFCTGLLVPQQTEW